MPFPFVLSKAITLPYLKSIQQGSQLAAVQVPCKHRLLPWATLPACRELVHAVLHFRSFSSRSTVKTSLLGSQLSARSHQAVCRSESRFADSGHIRAPLFTTPPEFSISCKATSDVNEPAVWAAAAAAWIRSSGNLVCTVVADSICHLYKKTFHTSHENHRHKKAHNFHTKHQADTAFWKTLIPFQALSVTSVKIWAACLHRQRQFVC